MHLLLRCAMSSARNAVRAVHRLLGFRCMKNADIPPRGGGGNAPSRRRGAERGRVSTDDVAHRQDHCSAWRFLVYRVERLRCAIACGNGVLHSCIAEWARRSRDVLLAVRVRKSGLQRAGCRLTAGRSDPTESAAEKKTPTCAARRKGKS